MVYRAYERNEPPPWSPHPDLPEGQHGIKAPEHPDVIARRERNGAWIRCARAYREAVRNSVPYLDPMLECFKARQLRKREVEALERLAGPPDLRTRCFESASPRPLTRWQRFKRWCHG